MKCAVMQPTYFPWAGYFSLIARVDTFVFLDDAQYEKGSWQNRNRVLVNGAPHWLTVPAQRAHLGQAINEVAIDERRHWRQKHHRLLAQSYAQHPHAQEMLDATAPVLDPALATLAELNIRLISELARALGIGTPLLRSSALGIPGKRSARLIAILEQLGCEEYVSPPGASGYLEEDGFRECSAIQLSYHNYQPAPYAQPGAVSFVSHLSLLDVIANLGIAGTSDYVKWRQA